MNKATDDSVPLAGRRVMVTGGGSGIGRAIAELAARQGARVALVGRTRSKLEEVARCIDAVAIAADVTQESEVRNAVGSAVDALGGIDVNIASVAGLLPGISGAAYAAAKGGQIVFSRALAVELAPHVRVNTLCAGPTDTPLSRPNIDTIRNAGGYDDFIKLFPLRRIAEPMDMAPVATFLLSARASHVTGAVWTADGGRSLH